MRRQYNTQNTDVTSATSGFCLTKLSTLALIGGAAGASAILWAAIAAVL